MGKKTSIEISDEIKSLLERFRTTYGLKNTVAAGILVFSKLPAEEREKTIAEVNKMVDIDISAIKSKFFPNAQAIRNVLREITAIDKQSPGTIIEILSEEKSTLLDDARKALGPEPQKQKEKKVKGA